MGWRRIWRIWFGIVKKRTDLQMYVCAYKPSVTEVRDYRRRETDGNVEICHWWWFGGSCGGNLFRKLERWPMSLFLFMLSHARWHLHAAIFRAHA